MACGYSYPCGHSVDAAMAAHDELPAKLRGVLADETLDTQFCSRCVADELRRLGAWTMPLLISHIRQLDRQASAKLAAELERGL